MFSARNGHIFFNANPPKLIQDYRVIIHPNFNLQLHNTTSLNELVQTLTERNLFKGDALEDEFLLSLDSDIYLKSSLKLLSADQLKNLNIYFLVITDKDLYQPIHVSKIFSTTEKLVTSKTIPIILKNLTMGTSELNAPELLNKILNSNFAWEIANDTVDNIFWILCQRYIVSVSTAGYSKKYEDLLKAFQLYFDHRSKQIKEFYQQVIEAISSNKNLTELQNKTFTPDKLGREIGNSLSDEDRRLRQRFYDDFEKYTVSDKTLLRGYIGLLAATYGLQYVGLGPVTIPLWLIGYILKFHREYKRIVYERSMNTVDDKLHEFVGMVPVVKYLSEKLRKDEERLDAIGNTIKFEMAQNASYKTQLVITEVKDTYYQRVLNYFKPAPKILPSKVEEPEETQQINTQKKN